MPLVPFSNFKTTMKAIILFLIRVYQKTLSPDHGLFSSLHPNGYCRFHPTCSMYAHEAIERFGIFRGGWMAIKRIGRCHPWATPGFDPVPKH